ncbi:MAG: bifunctional phosphopantothenoylcysteine decarboxylase/phosphopantothenate--cysteine ligase CoaBC [bacterium]
MVFEAKKIAVGVTGGIAAYKACELVRELKKLKAEVRVVMTKAAQEFVTPLSFATLSENPVLLSLFEKNEELGVLHIDLARWCDVLVICPATANILGKVASGLADDALSTTIIATNSPVIFCPAMNSVMWQNYVVQENVRKLKSIGYEFVDPDWGLLATHSEGEGWGRLAAIPQIVQKIKYQLFSTDELKGEKVLITAGPTQEPIDPVRFISNYSSGKMGFALAEAAKLKGAEVALISGPNQLDKPEGVKYIEVNTAEEMLDAVEKEYQNCDIVLMAAAVADYKPKQVLAQKLRKSVSEFNLDLVKTPDILGALAKKKENRVHVGFALETDNEVANAIKKLHSKKLDMIVINNPLEAESAFKWDTNKVSIITKGGHREQFPKLPKSEVAQLILNKICEFRQDDSVKVAAI